jgi:general stress protein YciG
MSDEKVERKRGRGFAGMAPEAQRALASKGGVAAHARGTAHQFTPEEAAAAGRKGGKAASRDAAHMAEIGRRGGLARGKKARAKARAEETEGAR